MIEIDLHSIVVHGLYNAGQFPVRRLKRHHQTWLQRLFAAQIREHRAGQQPHIGLHPLTKGLVCGHNQLRIVTGSKADKGLFETGLKVAITQRQGCRLAAASRINFLTTRHQQRKVQTDARTHLYCFFWTFGGCDDV